MNGNRALAWYAAGISLFHLWANTIGMLPTLWLNAIHVGLLGALGCWTLAGRGKTGATTWLWSLLALLFLTGGFYLPLAEEALRTRGELMTPPDLLIAWIVTAGVIFLCGRVSGWAAPCLALVAVGYVLFLGRYLDGVFHFPGLGAPRLLYRYYFTGEGLFGLPTTIAATYVYMFLLFSAFLLKSGAAETIRALAGWLAARLPGGAGYASVAASAITGTITGSAVANTVSTGAITIPIMKRGGFSATKAAAIETAASTGGQLMPPIMGAGAFLMAQYSGIPYATIIAAAFLPALLYFIGVGCYVHFEAQKNPAPLPPAKAGATLKMKGGLAVLGCAIIGITAMLLAGFTPTYAAAAGMALILVVSWLTPGQHMGWRSIFEALVQAAQWMVTTTLLLACTGILVGTLTMTGLSTAVSQLVLSWSGGLLPVALILLGLISLVAGMGLPVTASYIVLAVVAVPALQELGVALLAAHLIVFWLSQDSNVTPPVCLAAFTAASIAQSPPMRTGLQAWRAAKALYLVVILFAYTNLVEGGWEERLWITFFAALGLYAATAVLAGYGRPLRRAFLAVAAVLLFIPSAFVNIAGLLLLVAVRFLKF